MVPSFCSRNIRLSWSSLWTDSWSSVSSPKELWIKLPFEFRGCGDFMALCRLLTDRGEHYAFLVAAVDLLICVLHRLILVLNHVRKDVPRVYLGDLDFGSYFFCIFVYCGSYVDWTVKVLGVSLPLFDLEVAVLKVFIWRYDWNDWRVGFDLGSSSCTIWRAFGSS